MTDAPNMQTHIEPDVIEGDEPTPVVVDLGPSAPIAIPLAGGGEAIPGPPGPGVAEGGTEGQVLAKASSADYDTEWVDPSSGGADLSTYSQVSSLPDYPTEFPPDMSGVTASDVGALPDTTAIPSTPGDIGAQPAGDYATGDQGDLADSALQPGDLAGYATTADLAEGLSGKQPVGDYLTEEDLPAPPDLSPYATTADLDTVAESIPTTPTDIGAATAEQGAKADTAVQPADLPTIPSQIVTSVNEQTGDVVLTGADIESTFPGPEAPYTVDEVLDEFFTGMAQVVNAVNGKANSADLANVATSGSYEDLTDTPSIPSRPEDIGAQPAGSYATSAELDAVAGSIPTLPEDLVTSPSVRRIITSTDPEEPLQEGDLLLVREPVRQFFTDFTEYAIGSAPSGWTDRWVSIPGITIASVPDAPTGGQALRLNLPSGTARTFLSWDEIGEQEDVEMIGRYRITSGANSNNFVHPGMCVRGTGSAGTEQGYRGFRYWYQDLPRCALQAYESGPSDYGQSWIELPQVGSFTNPNWHWIRVRVHGPMLYAQAWKDGFTQPADWQVSHVAAGLQSGLVGLGGLNECTVEWDCVGVGLGGYTAPTGPVS